VEDDRPDVIVHFAAESHVTRGENAAEAFFRSNVEGTRRVLEAAERAGTPKVIHVSTDEVYGPCFGEPFKESNKEPGEGKATSSYARSKALADDLALSFADRIDVVVVRPTNCFGPWQHPEKAVARWAVRGCRGQNLPVWGDGLQVRDWMYVDDACSGIEAVVEGGATGEAYNLAPEGSQLTNGELAKKIAGALGLGDDAVYLTQYDRPQHDRRYAVDASKIRELGWGPSAGLDERISQTVAWYRDNPWWWERLVADAEALYDDAAERTATS
jgi:dTDP-glucose 4,6-dehydratase